MKRGRQVFFAAIIFALILFLPYSKKRKTEAATITLHNLSTNQYTAYNGTLVQYKINGSLLSNTYPGMIASDGSAIGPCKEIFEDGLSARFQWITTGKTFQLSFGATTVKMTLDSLTAYVNEKKVTLPAAPRYYTIGSDPEKKVYVPTRFLSETFGFPYQWNAVTKISSIEKPNKIYDNSTPIDDNSVSVSLFLQYKGDKAYSTEGLILDGEVFFPAKTCFFNSGLTKYSYAEDTGVLELSSKDHSVLMVLDSPVAFVDDQPFLMPAVPRLITKPGSSKAEFSVPILFTAKALGFSVTYQEASKEVVLSGPSISSPLTPDKVSGNNRTEYVPDSHQFSKVLFSDMLSEEDKLTYIQNKAAYFDGMTAYECAHSDAIFLKGIKLSDLTVTDRGDEIEISSELYQSSLAHKAGYYPENRYLNYYFAFGNLLRIKILKFSDIQFYSYDVPGGCMIHFTDINGLFEDELTFIQKEIESEDSGILAEEPLLPKLPPIVFSKESVVIPLPVGVVNTSVTDEDDYQNKCFRITLKGNYISFLKSQEVYNKNEVLSNITYLYNSDEKTTSIQFKTKKIQAYTYEIKDGFLNVTIKNPRDLYDKIVVLDAGHGGIDPGTQRNGVLEKTVNYNVIKKYAPAYFANSDIKVYYTRNDDTKVSLEDRARFASEVGADFFISFHVNANTSSSVSGTNVYYSSSNNKITASGLSSSILAKSLQKHMVSEWGTRDRGILTAKFDVIHKNSVPAVLVECAFITNNNDFAKIKSTEYQKKAAKAIYDSVTELFQQYQFR